jgi:cysteine desulfurase
MLPYFTSIFGNAASKSHEFGWKAEQAVENVRAKIAGLIGADPPEIIFTSGATESDNLAIKGASEYYRTKGNKIITVPTEHKAVLDTCEALQRKGFEIKFLNVDRYGLIDTEEFKKSIDDSTIFVSVMTANNEIGTIQPIKEIGRICKERGILFHTDAVQAAGKIPLNVNDMNIDLMSLSAHKMYGPKGIGVLYIRSKKPAVRLVPQIVGGGHERGFRSGTLNVPAIVGFGKAFELAVNDMESESERLRKMRDKLYNGINTQLDHVYLNGHPELRLPNNLNIAIEYVDADSLMMSMKEIAISSGSACTSASVEPSHVLKAIGLIDDLRKCSVRFGLGRFNTDEEIDYTIKKVVEKAKKIRELSPDYSVRVQ